MNDVPIYRAMAMPDGPQLLESISSLGRRGNGKQDDAVLNVSLVNKNKVLATEYEDVVAWDDKDVVTRSNWNVQECCLSPLPVYHPLECTHCIVRVSHASPQLIAARISDACAQMSLAALYNDKRGVAQLLSSDFCEMIVRLYASKLDGELNATIVEVQRRNGNSLSFHQYARKLLGAAQGIEDLDLDDVIKTAPPLPAEIFDKIIDVEERENAIAALVIAGNLLKKDRMDANQLGMESLCLLTDPTKTGSKTATIVSRAILTGSTKPVSHCVISPTHQNVESFEEEDALLHNLSFRKTILSLIQFKKLSDDDDDPPGSDVEVSESDNLVDDEDSVDDGQQRRSFEAEHADALHNLALAVLANSLEMIAKDGSLCDMMDQQQWLGDAALVKTLLDILRRAEKKPHDAMLSARCLSSLVDSSTKAIEHAMQLGAISIVMQAKNIGRKRHLSLARESNNVYKVLCHNL